MFGFLVIDGKYLDTYSQSFTDTLDACLVQHCLSRETEKERMKMNSINIKEYKCRRTQLIFLPFVGIEQPLKTVRTMKQIEIFFI